MVFLFYFLYNKIVKGGYNMNYSMIKMVVYLFSMVAVMYALSCLRFESWLKKGKVTQFYALYMIIVLVLTYLLSQLVFDLMTIRLL